MSNDSSNNSKDATQKKRKMWRTVNVSSGGGPSQSMTPEAAAKYIQKAASQSASPSGGNGREVKISFGPSRPPTTSSNSSRSINLGNLDLQALKETAAAAAAAGKPNGGKSSSSNKDGLPCTEAEMKALMSMFVEIMGMSMDSEKMKTAARNHVQNSSNMKKGPVFMFGNSNGIPMPPGGWSDASAESMAAATAGFFADGASWEAIRRTYGGMMGDEDEDDDEEEEEEYDDDSLPNLDDMRQLFQAQQKSHFEAMARSRMSSSSINREIPPSDWESLEQVAMDDALEAEERARRAAKKREKKQRKKQKQKEEAAEKAAEAALKKKEKAILSWRSRVVSACQSNEVSKLDALLHESPLRKAPDEESLSKSYIMPHLEFLLPNSVAKNRSVLNRGREARKRLAEYILNTDMPIVFQPLRSGRTALHLACSHGDLAFLKLVLERVKDCEDERMPKDYLELTCNESGWSLLHYASVSGSKELLEYLLQEGCNVSTITDDMHTWRKSDGKGVTARELIQYIHRNEHEKVLETHGVALQDMMNTFCSNHSERRQFQNNLHRVLMRLTDIEVNGYSPPKQNEAAKGDDSENRQSQDPRQESTSSRKRKKKKKKKKQAQKAAEEARQEAAKAAAIQDQKRKSNNDENKDPLVLALIGMGFAEDQINAAVKACGGTNRATADDLVTWILGQDGDGNTGSVTSGGTADVEITSETTVKTIAFDQVQRAESAAKEKEEASKRLAAKREEQRRRNRAWNNREQNRQLEAAKMKVTKAMMPPHQVAAPPPPTMYAAAYPTLRSTISSGSGTAPAAAKPVNKPIVVPKQTANIPSKILSKQAQVTAAVPKKAPIATTTTTEHSPSDTFKKIEIAAAASAPDSKVLKKPESQEKPKAAPKTKAVPRPATKSPPTVHSPPEIRNVVREPRKEKPLENNADPFLAQQKKATSSKPAVKSSAPASNDAFSLRIPGEEKSAMTQPSLTRLSVSAAALAPPVAAHTKSTVPPPGFMAPTSTSNMQPNRPSPGVGFPPLDSSILNPSNGMGLPIDHRRLGEIRATAKAFVPTSFGSSMPPLSGAFANPQPSSDMSPLGVLPTAPEGKSNMQSAFPPGILSGGLGGSSGIAPGLMESDKLNRQERMPAMTPISTDSTTNATSASLSGFEDSNFAGIPLGFGMDISQSSGGTSSLLDSFAAAGGNVGASSIWGGPQPSALGGFSAFGGLGGGNAPIASDPGYKDGNARNNHNNNSNNNSSSSNSNLWGGGANPATGNPGSIW